VTARSDRFFLLDSLRGVAALMVLAVHTVWFSGAGLPERWYDSYGLRLEAAFAIFFVISGFLLYRPFVKARLLDRPPIDARAYGWRRFLRIVPAFWVALIAISIWIGPSFSSLGEVVRNFGFLQLYWGAGVNDVIPQAWTLCVEVVFYATLPLWAWLMRRVPGRDLAARARTDLIGVSCLIVASLVYSAVLVYSHAVDPITFAPVGVLAAMPGYMDHIGLGMLLAVLSVWAEERRGEGLPSPVAFLARHPVAALAIAAAAMLGGALIIGDEARYAPTEYMVRHLLNSVVAVAVVIPAVFGDAREGAVRRVLGSPAIVYIGLISYGFYLFHWAVLRQLFNWQLDGTLALGSFWEWFALALAGSLVLGSLSYYLVERPALTLKRLVPRERREDRQDAHSERAPAAPVTAPPA
jgi:peptidoglycan/LPS O-acetylase OafA/YrhL